MTYAKEKNRLRKVYIQIVDCGVLWGGEDVHVLLDSLSIFWVFHYAHLCVCVCVLNSNRDQINNIFNI